MFHIKSMKIEDLKDMVLAIIMMSKFYRREKIIWILACQAS